MRPTLSVFTLLPPGGAGRRIAPANACCRTVPPARPLCNKQRRAGSGFNRHSAPSSHSAEFNTDSVGRRITLWTEKKVFYFVNFSYKSVWKIVLLISDKCDRAEASLKERKRGWKVSVLTFYFTKYSRKIESHGSFFHGAWFVSDFTPKKGCVSHQVQSLQSK